MLNRRRFLKLTLASGASLLVPWRFEKAYPEAGVPLVRAFGPPTPGDVLDPTSIPKYAEPLVIPPAMPPAERNNELTKYAIAVRQFRQQVLPSSMPKTTVWGYGSAAHPGPGSRASTYNFPAYTVDVRKDERVRVLWINGLVDRNRRFRRHLLPVDQTLHWANPPGPRDSHGVNPKPYKGPVPIVTHVHGAHVSPVSDGLPDAWYLPRAENIPDGYHRRGSFYGSVIPAPSGSAWFEYSNDRGPATQWYHDHVLGITRLNVYAGLAGFWLIRSDEEDSLNLPGPAPRVGDPSGTKYYEIPLAVQDRSFKPDGSLFYPRRRAFFEGLEPSQLRIPFIPKTACDGLPSDVPPIWNPEFFGNTIVVNGRTWPFLEVEQRRYRLRFLNGCNSRFLILKFDNDLPFHHIGAEGGFLAAPVQHPQLLLAPGERADVIVDFGGMSSGTTLTLLNLGPDEPFGGGVPGVDFEPADPNTTGQVMQFRVVPASSPDTSTPPDQLVLPPVEELKPSTTRRLSLNEEVSESVRVVTDANGNIVLACDDPTAEPFGPTEATLGVVQADGTPVSLDWSDPATEFVEFGATEIWELYNFTADAHPIHPHEVVLKVVNREIFDPAVGTPGTILPPESWETGFKDTAISYPGMISRFAAKFDIKGRYVWHCHILEHEDNEMMREYFIKSSLDQ